jgi:hypothetical protein
MKDATPRSARRHWVDISEGQLGGPRGARTHNPRIKGRRITTTVAPTCDYANTESPISPTGRPWSTAFHATNHATPPQIGGVRRARCARRASRQDLDNTTLASSQPCGRKRCRRWALESYAPLRDAADRAAGRCNTGRARSYSRPARYVTAGLVRVPEHVSSADGALCTRLDGAAWQQA